MKHYGCAFFVTAFALAACGGGSTSVVPTPAPTPGPVTFVQSGGSTMNPPTLVFTITFGGTVTRTVNGSQLLTAQLTAVQTAQLYADVKNASPLSALPEAGYPDFPSITVSWQGQTSPDIFDGTSAAEVALQTDFGYAIQLFPSAYH